MQEPAVVGREPLEDRELVLKVSDDSVPNNLAAEVAGSPVLVAAFHDSKETRPCKTIDTRTDHIPGQNPRKIYSNKVGPLGVLVRCTCLSSFLGQNACHNPYHSESQYLSLVSLGIDLSSP